MLELGKYTLAQLAEDLIYYLLQDDNTEENITVFKQFISNDEYRDLLKIFMKGK